MMANDNGAWFNLDDIQYMQHLKDQAAEASNPYSRQEYEKSAAVLERAVQILEVNGVPRERMRTISNGIDVLVTRFTREVMALETTLHRSHRAQAAQKRELEGMRLLLEQQAKKKQEG